MSNSHKEEQKESNEIPRLSDHFNLKRWIEAYNLTQAEAGDTFGLTQVAISRMLDKEEKGKRIFYLVEDPSDYWNLIEVSKRHSGKFTWL